MQRGSENKDIEVMSLAELRDLRAQLSKESKQIYIETQGTLENVLAISFNREKEITANEKYKNDPNAVAELKTIKEDQAELREKMSEMEVTHDANLYSYMLPVGASQVVLEETQKAALRHEIQNFRSEIEVLGVMQDSISKIRTAYQTETTADKEVQVSRDARIAAHNIVNNISVSSRPSDIRAYHEHAAEVKERKEAQRAEVLETAQFSESVKVDQKVLDRGAASVGRRGTHDPERVRSATTEASSPVVPESSSHVAAVPDPTRPSAGPGEASPPVQSWPTSPDASRTATPSRPRVASGVTLAAARTSMHGQDPASPNPSERASPVQSSPISPDASRTATPERPRAASGVNLAATRTSRADSEEGLRTSSPGRPRQAMLGASRGGNEVFRQAVLHQQAKANAPQQSPVGPAVDKSAPTVPTPNSGSQK